MVYVYCPKPSEGVKDLVAGLKANLITAFDGLNFWFKRDRLKLGPDDVLVCWGEPLQRIEGIKMLNGCEAPLGDFQVMYHLRSELGISVVRMDVIRDTNAAKARASGYIPRSNKHLSGSDILLGTSTIDYWSQRVDYPNQFRCHVLNGKLIRCGIKVQRSGTNLVPEAEWKPGAGLCHPWVKTELGGWTIDYGDVKHTSTLRNFATAVQPSMGLDMCTLDIALTYGGDAMLMGINFAPDLPDKKSVDGYVGRIEKWIKGISDDGSTKVAKF